MKISLLAVALSALTFGINAKEIQKPDAEFIQKVAHAGITQDNWDSGKAAKLTMKNAYRFTHHVELSKSEYTHDIGKASGFDLNSVTAQDFDGEQPMSIILRDRLNQESLVILKNGQLVDEFYWSGMHKDRTHLMMSVTKSFTSMTLAILANDGLVDMDSPITKYIPELKTSPAYAKATVQEVADMRSGVLVKGINGKSWDERMTSVQEWNGPNAYPEISSVAEFGALLGARDKIEPGEAYDYQCINTEMLGMVITSVTEKTVSEVMEEKLWKKVGFEHNAYMQTNSQGEAVASGGLNATTRDVARMMDVLVNNGKNRRGEQIVPKAFVDSLITGNNDVKSAWKKGKESKLVSDAWYKDQVRTFNVDGHKFLAFVGIHGQVVIGEPSTGIVLAMTGAQDERESHRTVLMTFLNVVPSILIALK
ncbi:beta-lactamase family protein [Vibrio makurazakiensis]|uniref:serine hydrolase domain-containing protein n=1 Tax=Vibrio makurazakiensis TaxID=2910250 RepID=UPI003D0B42BF